MLSGNIENVTIKEKAKFPQEFFPDVCIVACVNLIDATKFQVLNKPGELHLIILSTFLNTQFVLFGFSLSGQEKASLELGGIYAIGQY